MVTKVGDHREPDSTIPKTHPMRRLLLITLMGAVAMLSSDSTPRFTKQDKAFYKDASIINFVRPGLQTTIKEASIDTDGTIHVRFTVTDTAGLPLDRAGVYTPGPISTSFLIATIPDGEEQYVAYTTRQVTSTITGNTATQAAADSGGTYTQNSDGDYTYTFKTKAPVPLDRRATHTVGVYSSRNLSEFDLGTNYDDDTLDFIPSGGDVTRIRKILNTSSCNSCHDPLSAHGGSRKSVELCILCHTPQSSDPDTGNTIDFKVMIHKIHRGADLPSVRAGTPYQIIGFRDSVNDYSHVEFPSDVRNCTICHTPTAPQATEYFDADRAACGSCHDNVNFATGENHINLPQLSDKNCTQCHVPQGDLEFDASILGAHTIPTMSSELPGVVFELVSAMGKAGEKPTVQFKVHDDKGNPIAPADMTRLSLVLTGPTSDYLLNPVSATVTGASASADGTATFTFPNALPADAKGTFSVGIEGYRNVTLLAGTTREQVAKDRGKNKVINFSVDGSAVKPRRQVVDTAKCNSCHTFLSLHGDNRNQVEMCVLCHNPNATDVSRRPADQGPPQAINFAQMIHKIHTGENLEQDFTIYGFGGSVNNFNDVLFPGDRRDCAACHVNGSEEVPIGATAMVTDPRGPIDPIGPIASACTGCHTNIATASHALTNTSRLGEACATCHEEDAQFSVSRVHAR